MTVIVSRNEISKLKADLQTTSSDLEEKVRTLNQVSSLLNSSPLICLLEMKSMGCRSVKLLASTRRSQRNRRRRFRS